MNVSTAELDIMTASGTVDLIMQLNTYKEEFVMSLEERYDDENGLNYYVASSQRSTFHRPSCKWATYILDSPNLIEFSSHDEATDADYKPCKTCRA